MIKENVETKKLQRVALLNKYSLDQLEQYSRRETIRVTGISQEIGDDQEALATAMINTVASIGVEIQRSDISVIHRVGRLSLSSFVSLILLGWLITRPY